VAQYGAVISKEARKLADLIERVLLFASAREAAHRYQLRPVDIVEVIDSTLAASADLIQASGFVVERDIDKNLPPALADPLGVSQCLQNLVTNALKYGGERRWMRISATVSTNGHRPEVQVIVSDRGIGIAPSELEQIFKPFYRSPTVAGVPGLGLGLTVARSVAEAMHGHLTSTSEVGRGSTFTLRLPSA
jgi:signal transduction histidine kinase